MLPYAGYVDPESTLAIGVHHDGHLEDTERTFCSLYHTFIFGCTPFAQHPSKGAYKIKLLARLSRPGAWGHGRHAMLPICCALSTTTMQIVG